MDLSKLSDTDLQAISLGKMDKVSDEGLHFLANPELPQYNPMQSLGDVGHAVLQGATLGYGPQVAAGVQTLSTSGLEYEAAKKAERERLVQAKIRNPSLLYGGQMLGGALPMLAAPEIATPLKSAAVGAGLGFAQNPGEDLTLSNLKDRLKNMGIMGTLGGVFGKVAQSSGPSAETYAFRSLNPTKRAAMLMRQKGSIQDIGRTMLDEGVIGNIPRGGKTLYNRASDVASQYGAQKSDIINNLSGIEAQKGLPGVNINDVRQGMQTNLAINPNHPESLSRASRAADFAEGVAPGKEYLPLNEADQLKIDAGNYVNWLKGNSLGIDPDKQAFNLELYRQLNSSVDKSAEKLAQQYSPESMSSFLEAKQKYGNMDDAKRMLDNKIAAETTRHAMNPMDLQVGAAGALGAELNGSNAMQSGKTGLSLGLAHKLLRTYGNQVAAKQLNNLSGLLNTPTLYNGAMGASASGLRQIAPWQIYEGEQK